MRECKDKVNSLRGIIRTLIERGLLLMKGDRYSLKLSPPNY